MKRINYFLLVFVLIFSINKFSVAQQDYQIVQNFKTQYLQIQKAIKNADSLAQLPVLQEAVAKLKNDFLPDKVLLDKSLYPDDFNASITNLNNALQLRERDFTQISSLQFQVGELKIQIDSLNTKNAFLLNRIQLLHVQSLKDKKTIAALQQNISSLMVSLHKRDLLIMNMLDSLMPPEIREKSEINKSEKQKVYSEAQKENVLTNIKRAINENIKFLELTYLNPDDIENIKKQENQFEILWKSMSPQFVEIYSVNGENGKDINEINSGFANWRKALYLEAWSTIRQDFRSYRINLNNFTNGNEFTSQVTSYIDDEIKNTNLQPDESKKAYKMFADSAWFGNIKPKWMAYLTDNKMLSVEQKDSIETKIAQWKESAFPVSSAWTYIFIAAIIILIVILYFVRKRKTSKNPYDLPGSIQDKKDS